MTDTTADIVVVGLGAMGSAALYQLARRGVRAIGIDRFHPPHDRGSSHGETRVTRTAVAEGPAYVPFALRSHELWREIEAATGRHLYLDCGFLAIDATGGQDSFHAKAGFVEATIEAARTFNIRHEEIDAVEVMRRYPQFRLDGYERAYFEPEGGVVFPERCIAAQLDLATQAGAEIRTGETVLDLQPDGTGTRIRTDKAAYSSARVILTAGAWLPGMAPTELGSVRILRQTLHWFAVADPTAFAPDRFPSFTLIHGAREDQDFYGFPIVGGLTPGLKVAEEQFQHAIDAPESLDRNVSPEETSDFFNRHVRGRIPGAGPAAIQARACLYSFVPDGDFVVDRSETNRAVLLVSACSGHGFKHSAAIGEHAARVTLGEIEPEPAFDLHRAALQDAFKLQG